MSSKKIDNLTPEQEKMIPVYVNKYLNLVNKYQYLDRYKRDTVTALIDWQYEYAGFAKPMVLLASNPFEAQMMNTFLEQRIDLQERIKDYLKCTNEEEKEAIYQEVDTAVRGGMQSVTKIQYKTDSVFTSSLFANVLLGWWGYLIDVLKLESSVTDVFFKWRELYENAGVYNSICNDIVCITSKYPIKLCYNETNELHCITGPAVEWEGIPWKCYYINGRNIPETEYEMAINGNVTKNVFMNQGNEEIKAAWYEILGQNKIMEILGATEIDKHTFNHSNGETEEVTLYKTTETFPETGGNPLAWVKFVCPSTGTNYLIDVEPHHTSAKAAAISTSPFAEIIGEDYSFDDRA